MSEHKLAQAVRERRGMVDMTPKLAAFDLLVKRRRVPFTRAPLKPGSRQWCAFRDEAKEMGEEALKRFYALHGEATDAGLSSASPVAKAA